MTNNPASGCIVDGRTDVRSAKGRARAAEIVRENAAEIEKITAHLIAGLNHPATAGEQVEAEFVAATIVKSRRLRERGRDDGPERRLLQRLMRETAFGSVPAPHPAEVQHGKAVGDAFAARDRAFRAASVEQDQENYQWYRSVAGADAAGDPNAE